ncbi:MAG: zinc finger, C3HC4 type-domain-containing protein [Monoraphidium minutum]|nr:MAG: zinc finger, C3HC4 type-domain-containing protein [Monoraphidium minutum]
MAGRSLQVLDGTRRAAAGQWGWESHLRAIQQQYQQQRPQQPAGFTNGQFYGGYAPPQTIQQPVRHYGGQPPVAPPGRGPVPRPVAAQEYQQTSTIKNQVNLKKPSLKVVPLEGRPHEFRLEFAFDASAPCRVTTFLLATEEPAQGCRLRSAVLGAPPRTPAAYPKGRDLKFPPEGDAAAAEAHIVSSLHAPLGHMMLAAGDSFPLVVRLETLMEDAWGSHSLEELEVGGPFPQWAQAQTTYAKLKQGDDGSWQARARARPHAPTSRGPCCAVVVLKQKIWVRGVSYELQEIYGMDGGGGGHPGAAGSQHGQGGGAGYDEVEGRECVICMSAPRDTTALPCRHMCMCRECAGALKRQSNKCPICRNEIESLLHIKIARRTPEPGSSPVR